ncbi:hypothetical protein OBBRIDRAFT_742992, partial [Obba rivulosa]
MTGTSTATKNTSSCLYDVLLLEDDGSNFQTWKYCIKTVLQIRDLWTVVDGTDPKP